MTQRDQDDSSQTFIAPDEMLDQLHHRLHVWIVRPGTAGAASIAENEFLLSDVERGRHRRFVRAGDRHLFLAAHVLVRRTLSRYFDIAPHEWTFESNQYGRPEITNPESPTGLRFNLSHTEGLVALVVHDEVDSGVDVERIGRVENLLSMAETVFSDAERAEFLALPAGQQEARFYRLWTLKEAFIKAKGMGLALPLKDFWFAAKDPMALRLGCLDSIDTEPEAWAFTVRQPSPHHVLATACRSGQDRQAREVNIFDISAGTKLSRSYA